jgi:hypothetical protein
MAISPESGARIESSQWGMTRSREAIFLPIWLLNDERRPIREEETETQGVSRCGAGLSCRRFVEPTTL